MTNKIVLNDIIGYGESSVYNVRNRLEHFGGQPVDVEINSPGGNVFEGLEIFHLFKNYPGFVTMHVVSIAASMASTIMLAGDKITAEESHVVMIHNASGYMGGDYRDMQKYADFLKSVNEMLGNIVAKKTGKKLEKVLKMMDEETYLFSQESLDFGIVDEIIKLSEKEPESKNDALAYARISIEDCFDKLKAEKSKKEDFERVAALMQFEDKKTLDKQKELKNVEASGKKPPASAGDKKTEVSKMLTLEQFKNENFALYNQVFDDGLKAGIEEGIKRERGRTSAHLKWIDTDAKNVIKAIENGKSFDASDLSGYTKAALNKKDLSIRGDENPDVVETPDTEIDEDQAVKDWSEKIMSNMKKPEGSSNA